MEYYGHHSDDDNYPEVDSDGEVLDVPDARSIDTIKSEESALTKNNSFRYVCSLVYASQNGHGNVNEEMFWILSTYQSEWSR